MIESVIFNHKKATGGVKAAFNIRGKNERQGQEAEMWINTLQDMIYVTETLAKDAIIDVYSIFLKKLLEKKVTSSIEHIIRT